jgi:hypothetical protein
MTRRFHIERFLRQVYGGMPTDDAQVTTNLVNASLNDAVAFAAKQCYKESLSIDGVAYVNNTFYTTFRNLPITADSDFVWKLTLPEMPLGLGVSDGVNGVQLKDAKGSLSDPLIPLSANQVTYQKGLKQPQNKIMYWNEGKDIFIKTVLPLAQYKGQVRMISGGLSSDVDSELNLPPDYEPAMDDYLFKRFGLQRNQPQDINNDGTDSK